LSTQSQPLVRPSGRRTTQTRPRHCELTDLLALSVPRRSRQDPPHHPACRAQVVRRRHLPKPALHATHPTRRRLTMYSALRHRHRSCSRWRCRLRPPPVECASCRSGQSQQARAQSSALRAHDCTPCQPQHIGARVVLCTWSSSQRCPRNGRAAILGPARRFASPSPCRIVIRLRSSPDAQRIDRGVGKHRKA